MQFLMCEVFLDVSYIKLVNSIVKTLHILRNEFMSEGSFKIIEFWEKWIGFR